MVTIEKTAHVSSDGILRVEVPVPERDKDIRFVLVVDTQVAAPVATEAEDHWKELREKLARNPGAAVGITLPPPGPWRYEPFDPIDLPGPTASEILIRDRR
ncbi:MAG: hypothetical protein ACE15C_03495 [Phycisphaerae bacterium]